MSAQKPLLLTTIEDDHHVLRQTSPGGKSSQGYRPRALRVPTIALFFSLLATCVVLIEVLLHRSSRPSTGQGDVGKSAAPDDARKAVETVQSSPIACESCRAFSSIAVSLDMGQSSLCSQFASSFVTGVKLSPAESSAFNQWYIKYDATASSMESMGESILPVMASCSAQGEPLDTAFHDVQYWQGCQKGEAFGYCGGAGGITVANDSITVLPVITCPPPSSSWVSATSQTPAVTITLGKVAIEGRKNPSSPVLSTPTLSAPVLTTAGFPQIIPTKLSRSWSLPGANSNDAIAVDTQFVRPSLSPRTDASSAAKYTSASTADNVRVDARLGPSYTVTSRYSSFIATTDANGQSTDLLALIVSKTTLTGDAALSAEAPSTSGGVAPAATSSPTLANLTAMDVMVVNGTFSSFQYFIAYYLPPVLAVVIKAFWEIIFASFKMMEPFERLSQDGGAPAKESLFAQYLTNSVSIDSARSCFEGRGMMPFFTTLLYLFVTVLATLAASSMTIRATQICLLPNNEHVRCNPAWIIDLPFTRSVEALLVSCMVLVILIIVYMYTQKRKIAFHTNLSSIASIASLIGQDDTLVTELRSTDPLAETSVLSAEFEDHRYHLGYHENIAGESTYGIFLVTEPLLRSSSSRPKLGRAMTDRGPIDYASLPNPVIDPLERQCSSPFISSRWQTHLLDSAQLLSTLGLLGLVTTYIADPRSGSFNRFFNSETLPARLVFVAIATLVDIQWKRLEREVRITEPYRRMALGSQRAETTVLMNLNGTCWSSLFECAYKMLRFRHLRFQMLVSGAAALSDFNIIAVASMPYNDGQMRTSWLISAYFAVTATSSLAVVMLITMGWWRRGVVGEMPRCPDSIGVVASYLCASRFTQSLQRTLAQSAVASPKCRDNAIIAAGWRFSFGLKTGLDEKERWCVDYDADEVDEALVFSDRIKP